MPLVQDWEPSDPVQVLVYGQAKVGKSWGALTFPRPVVFDFDRGVATARNPDFIKKYGKRWIFYETFKENNMKRGIPLTANAFDDACRYFDEWMKPKGTWVSNGKKYDVGRDEFDTFIIDSGTTLSEVAQYKAVVVLGGMKLSKAHEQSMSSGLLIPRIQDYGSERSLVEQFVDMIKDSGKNVVMLCHEKEMTNDNGVVTSIVPLLTGKSSEVIPLKFDEVYNLRIKKKGLEVVRYLQTEPDGLRKVGSRYGMPNESVWDWDTVQAALKSIKATQRGENSPLVKKEK